ncbi:MAG: DSBA oxidoreductase [Parcubacteria group bacterium GW2011_GWF2_39_13b]|nr:MAG: DSBA oxidoreductase [Parcubacteria group bacterium GW2011_GWF2_39_13b]
MEQQNSAQNTIGKTIMYVLAALAGAGLIIYGAFFYTKPRAESQQASIIAKTGEQAQNAIKADFVDPVLGNTNAPITIIEYGSYLCGHCNTFSQEIFPIIYENYIKTGKVKFIYRSFPPYELGMALMCANEENKFWEYHDYAIQNQITEVDDLKTFAIGAGLNGPAFNECFDSGKYQETSEAIIVDGQNAGVSGTPTFFINNQKVVGALPYEDFAKAIDAELNK